MEVSDVNDTPKPDDTSSVYVGPRPYRFGQELFGRDREAVELTRLLISQRLVLLHSPSGAGKTSLIHARIVPALQKRRFEIPFRNSSENSASQPIAIRVNREPRETDPPGSNRYLLSTMLSLELLRPEQERRDVHKLAGISLDDYLEEAFPAASREVDQSRPEAESFRPLLLIFDQFEELVTMDPTDEAAKQEFVRQLGKALQNRGRWALFAIREDYLGALEPYLPAIPTNLSATYRLDLLRAEVASTVIEEPARKVNVTFEEGVIHEIVEDLRKIRIQAIDGSFNYKDGIYVEPVQLQVVCQSLWRIRDGSPVITHEHLKMLGQGRGTGVDAVLAGYYADRVAEAAAEEEVSERLVRNWFSKRLIGSQHVRRPVLVDEALSFGLTLHCLQVLDKAFLIRREIRSGATWYELAHDRLMAPVLEDNELWRQQHLTTFQSQAELWEDRARPDSLLLSGETLEEAEREAERLQAELTAYEQEFLEASQKARAHQLAEQAREQELSRVKILKKAVAAGALLLVVVTSLAAIALWQRHKALEQQMIAEQQTEIAQNQTEIAHWLGYAGNIGLAQQHVENDNLQLARDALGNTAEEDRGWEYDYLMARIDKIKNTFIGHEGSVDDVAFIWDGTRIVTASNDKSLKIWNTATREPVEPVLTGHSDTVKCLAVDPDEEWVVSGSDDNDLRIWNLETGASCVLKGHLDSVVCVVIDPSGQWIVSGSDDGSLRLWDVKNLNMTKLPASLRESREFENRHSGAVMCLAVTPDGQHIVSGGIDGTIRWWSNEGKLTATWESQNLPVTCIQISPDGTWMASGGLDRIVKAWDLQAGEDQEPLGIGMHEHGISSLAISPDGTRIAVGTRQGVLKEWNTEDLAKRFAKRPDTELNQAQRLGHWPTKQLQAHSGIILGLDYGFINGTLTVVSAGTDNTVKLWDGSTNDNTHVNALHWGPVWDVDLSPDGRSILSASADRRIRYERIDNDGNVETMFLTGHTDGVWSGSFSPDGNKIVSGSEDRTVRVWSVAPDNTHGKQLLTIREAHDDAVSCVSFSPDGKSIISSSYDNKIKLWNAETGVIIRVFNGHEDAVTCVKFSPDGKQVVSGGNEKILHLWDFETCKEIRTFEGHTAWVTSVAFSPIPDANRIVSGSEDNTVKLWETTTGQCTITLSDHRDTVWNVAFSPDGKRIISCSDDWTFRVWESSTVKAKP